MTEELTVDPENYIDVRYSKLYTGMNIVLALVFLAVATIYILGHQDDLLKFPGILFPVVYIIAGLLFLAGAITLRSRRYLRLDKKNKTLLVYGLFGPWSRKYPFDFMFFAGEKFHIDHGGKKLRLPILKYTCDKSDLNNFLKELSDFNLKNT